MFLILFEFVLFKAFMFLMYIEPYKENSGILSHPQRVATTPAGPNFDFALREYSLMSHMNPITLTKNYNHPFQLSCTQEQVLGQTGSRTKGLGGRSKEGPCDCECWQLVCERERWHSLIMRNWVCGSWCVSLIISLCMRVHPLWSSSRNHANFHPWCN